MLATAHHISRTASVHMLRHVSWMVKWLALMLKPKLEVAVCLVVFNSVIFAVIIIFQVFNFSFSVIFLLQCMCGTKLTICQFFDHREIKAY